MAEEDKKAAPKSITKAELFAELQKESGLGKNEVKLFFDALTKVIVKHLGKRGSKVLTLPGLFKLQSIKKAADKGGKMVKNPFTGEMVKSKPKPASMVVKVRPLKVLKEKLV